MAITDGKTVRCRLCSSENTKFLFSKQTFLKYDYKVWDIYECFDCDLKFIRNDQHPNFDYEEFYNFRYKDRITDDNCIYQNRKYWKEQVKILNRLSPQKEIKIMDIGCNAGNFLYHTPKSWIKYGVELSDLAIIGIKHGLNILQQNVEDIKVDNNFFDIITMYALIEHLVDIDKIFNKIHFILKPNGILAIMTGDSNSFKAKLKGENWHMYIPPEHQFFFTAKSLDNFLIKYDFQLAYRYYTGGGMTDYFRNKWLTKIISVVQSSIIDRSFIKKSPVLDHMYSYYKLIH